MPACRQSFHPPVHAYHPLPGRGMDSSLKTHKTTRHTKGNSSSKSALSLTLPLTPVPSFAQQAPLETSIRSHNHRDKVPTHRPLRPFSNRPRPHRPTVYICPPRTSCIDHWLNHDYLPPQQHNCVDNFHHGINHPVTIAITATAATTRTQAATTLPTSTRRRCTGKRRRRPLPPCPPPLLRTQQW